MPGQARNIVDSRALQTTLLRRVGPQQKHDQNQNAETDDGGLFGASQLPDHRSSANLMEVVSATAPALLMSQSDSCNFNFLHKLLSHRCCSTAFKMVCCMTDDLPRISIL